MTKNKKINNDISNTSGIQNTTKKDHKNTANFILAIIFIFMITIIPLVYFDVIHFPYTYHTAIITQAINASIGNEFHIIHMDSTVTFSTSSLSAQNPVDVTVDLLPDPNDIKKYIRDWTQTDPEIYAVFPNSVDYNQTLFKDTNYYQTGIVKLQRIDTPIYKYEGNGKIFYQFEGKYAYFIVTDHELRDHMKGKYEVLNSNEFGKRMTNDTYFPVGSSDFTTTIKTNNIFNALTLILITFGIFEIKNHLRRYLILIITRFRG